MTEKVVKYVDSTAPGKVWGLWEEVAGEEVTAHIEAGTLTLIAAEGTLVDGVFDSVPFQSRRYRMVAVLEDDDHGLTKLVQKMKGFGVIPASVKLD